MPSARPRAMLPVMTFAGLIVKNLLRQRVRTLLTVLGISVGITTVVALGVVTEGMKQTSGDLIRTGGADFMVAQDGASDFSFSTVPESDWARIARRPDVASAVGVLYNFASVARQRVLPRDGSAPRPARRDHRQAGGRPAPVGRAERGRARRGRRVRARTHRSAAPSTWAAGRGG